MSLRTKFAVAVTVPRNGSTDFASLMQQLEKRGLHIRSQHPKMGIATGDTDNEHYQKILDELGHLVRIEREGIVQLPNPDSKIQ